MAPSVLPCPPHRLMPSSLSRAVPDPDAPTLPGARPLRWPPDVPLPPGTPGACPRLWRLDLSQPPADDRCLSADEHARRDRFVFPRHQRRFATAHVLLRQLLGSVTGVDPAALAFDIGPQGKPSLAGPPGVGAFNLSHSDDIGLLLWAPGGGDWGVDVERLRAVPDADDVARLVFTPQECQEWAEGDAAGRTRRFLRLWTRKEACLKAIGSGLSIAPGRFAAGFAHQPVVIDLPLPDGDAARIWVADLPSDDDSVAALAVRLPRP
jgi:4'-phosphopantetheinyl transferase